MNLSFVKHVFFRFVNIKVLVWLVFCLSCASGYGNDAGTVYEFDFSPRVEGFMDQTRNADLLVEAIVQIESHGNPLSVGSAGERGVMQIKPGTWRETTSWMFGEPVPFDGAFCPQLNRQVGKAYLADIQIFINKHKDSWHDGERALLLACYNAGPNRVLEAGFDVMRLPAANRDYVERASALHDYYITSGHNVSRPYLLSRNNSILADYSESP